ncbi:hypothetical protein DIPPA_00229 [Diplonema papillatum]|nr:hypothetical protein DIPPA_00229 [Diplonema papillatum]
MLRPDELATVTRDHAVLFDQLPRTSRTMMLGSSEEKDHSSTRQARLGYKDFHRPTAMDISVFTSTLWWAASAALWTTAFVLAYHYGPETSVAAWKGSIVHRFGIVLVGFLLVLSIARSMKRFDGGSWSMIRLRTSSQQLACATGAITAERRSLSAVALRLLPPLLASIRYAVTCQCLEPAEVEALQPFLVDEVGRLLYDDEIAYVTGTIDLIPQKTPALNSSSDDVENDSPNGELVGGAPDATDAASELSASDRGAMGLPGSPESSRIFASAPSDMQHGVVIQLRQNCRVELTVGREREHHGALSERSAAPPARVFQQFLTASADDGSTPLTAGQLYPVLMMSYDSATKRCEDQDGRGGVVQGESELRKLALFLHGCRIPHNIPVPKRRCDFPDPGSGGVLVDLADDEWNGSIVCVQCVQYEDEAVIVSVVARMRRPETGNEPATGRAVSDLGVPMVHVTEDLVPSPVAFPVSEGGCHIDIDTDSSGSGRNRSTLPAFPPLEMRRVSFEPSTKDPLRRVSFNVPRLPIERPRGSSSGAQLGAARRRTTAPSLSSTLVSREVSELSDGCTSPADLSPAFAQEKSSLQRRSTFSARGAAEAGESPGLVVRQGTASHAGEGQTQQGISAAQTLGSALDASEVADDLTTTRCQSSPRWRNTVRTLGSTLEISEATEFAASIPRLSRGRQKGSMRSRTSDPSLGGTFGGSEETEADAGVAASGKSWLTGGRCNGNREAPTLGGTLDISEVTDDLTTTRCQSSPRWRNTVRTLGSTIEASEATASSPRLSRSRQKGTFRSRSSVPSLCSTLEIIEISELAASASWRSLQTGPRRRHRGLRRTSSAPAFDSTWAISESSELTCSLTLSSSWLGSRRSTLGRRKYAARRSLQSLGSSLAVSEMTELTCSLALSASRGSPRKVSRRRSFSLQSLGSTLAVSDATASPRPGLAGGRQKSVLRRIGSVPGLSSTWGALSELSDCTASPRSGGGARRRSASRRGMPAHGHDATPAASDATASPRPGLPGGRQRSGLRVGSVPGFSSTWGALSEVSECTASPRSGCRRDSERDSAKLAGSVGRRPGGGCARPRRKSAVARRGMSVQALDSTYAVSEITDLTCSVALSRSGLVGSPQRSSGTSLSCTWEISDLSELAVSLALPSSVTTVLTPVSSNRQTVLRVSVRNLLWEGLSAASRAAVLALAGCVVCSVLRNLVLFSSSSTAKLSYTSHSGGVRRDRVRPDATVSRVTRAVLHVNRASDATCSPRCFARSGSPSSSPAASLSLRARPAALRCAVSAVPLRMFCLLRRDVCAVTGGGLAPVLDDMLRAWQDMQDTAGERLPRPLFHALVVACVLWLATVPFELVVYFEDHLWVVVVVNCLFAVMIAGLLKTSSKLANPFGSDVDHLDFCSFEKALLEELAGLSASLDAHFFADPTGPEGGTTAAANHPF